MNKKLVAYFSATGTTKRVATDLAELSGSDIFEIKPQTIYTSADLDWQNDRSRSSVEMKNKNTFRPAHVKNGINPESYEEIFLAFPIWWYVAPTIVNTFLEEYDLTNKKITLIATSGSSNFEGTLKDLEPSAKGAILNEGILFKSGQYSKEKLAKWLDRR